MAKQVDFSQRTIVCECCGKTIEPNKSGFVVDYVWRDGRTLCIECNKKEGVKRK